jgi:hypothetical protein
MENLGIGDREFPAGRDHKQGDKTKQYNIIPAIHNTIRDVKFFRIKREGRG